jgi:hypothetical protein
MTLFAATPGNRKVLGRIPARVEGLPATREAREPIRVVLGARTPVEAQALAARGPAALPVRVARPAAVASPVLPVWLVPAGPGTIRA